MLVVAGGAWRIVVWLIEGGSLRLSVVMDQVHLFPMIRSEVQTLLSGYVQKQELTEGIDQFVVPPSLGNRAGVLGAIALAQMAAGEQS